jgi:hypothetical protein
LCLSSRTKILDARLRGHDEKESLGNVILPKKGTEGRRMSLQGRRMSLRGASATKQSLWRAEIASLRAQ